MVFPESSSLMAWSSPRWCLLHSPLFWHYFHSSSIAPITPSGIHSFYRQFVLLILKVFCSVLYHVLFSFFNLEKEAPLCNFNVQITVVEEVMVEEAEVITIQYVKFVARLGILLLPVIFSSTTILILHNLLSMAMVVVLRPNANPTSTTYIASPQIVTDLSWYIDSGATNLITSDLSNLTLQNDYKGKEKIIVGNGAIFISLILVQYALILLINLYYLIRFYML
ncbi:hypothetical protein TorRG33x02_309150 [Trema orientale]|uniref:Transmembrane protein n=1 Tax=Trema orientale TaxID=63057 RepID=A0A2P5BTQ5_TREOI|nr:hypothetical protein TorRG33x02_309150 [Trema orientale]